MNLISNTEEFTCAFIYLVCHDLGSCRDCTTTDIAAFDCAWCESLRMCSDGFNRHRQEWLESQCHSQVRLAFLYMYAVFAMYLLILVPGLPFSSQLALLYLTPLPSIKALLTS